MKLNLTSQSISKNVKVVDGLDGYKLIISKIENNISINPDIAIESCKSLIEGLCKKALKLLSNDYNSNKSIRKNCDNKLPTLVKTAFEEVFSEMLFVDLYSSSYNLIFKECRKKSLKERLKKIVGLNKEGVINDISTTIIKLSSIRDNRGDISHGRIYPKEFESEVHLAKSLASITDGICSYMVEEFSRQYSITQKKQADLVYDDMEEFNVWLNDKLSVFSVNVDYSLNLFTNMYEKYEEIYYMEYAELLLDNEEDDIEKISQQKEGVLDEVKKPRLVSTVHSVIYENGLTKPQLTLINQFAKNEILDASRLVKLIETYLFDKKTPLRDKVVNLFINKPKLKERKKIPKFTEKIINLIDQLEDDEEISDE